MNNYYVYIVQCRDGHYYIGITNDIERRMDEHNRGVDPRAFTFKRRPVTLVYVATFDDVLQAIAWEKRIKHWSRRKKEALIQRAYERLPSLVLNQEERNIFSTREFVKNHVMVRLPSP